MHRWVDDEGNIHFSQTPPPDQSVQESEVVSYGRRQGQGVDPSCCGSVRSFAMDVADYMQRGGTLSAVYEIFPVSAYPQIVEVVNFLGGQTSRSIRPIAVGKLIYDACMNRALQACRVPLGGEGSPRVVGSRTGSGVVVGPNLILTNEHVINSCREITVGDRHHRAELLGVDAVSDLAILKTDISHVHRVKFSRRDDVRLGEDVVTSGFPLSGVLGSLNITTGTVSAITPIPDSLHLFQITAPVQPGSSGGPVLDRLGHLLGIVVARLSDERIASRYGSIPQNVNFAIKPSSVKAFLRANGVEFSEAPTSESVPNEVVAGQAELFTIRVQCQ